MTTAQVRALAERHGVEIGVRVLGFGRGVRVTAAFDGWSQTVDGLDPDRAMVDAIERLAWWFSLRRGPDSGMGWAFDVFDDCGNFPVGDAA